MHFRLTYAGELLGTRSKGNAGHKHALRKAFHLQLKKLWQTHPVLVRGHTCAPVIGSSTMKDALQFEGFLFKPLVTNNNGLICSLDILMLRHGEPRDVVGDIDNRVKTIFDALAMPDRQQCLDGNAGKLSPADGEVPFFVLLQDDKLITSVSVASDMLLEPVPGCLLECAARLVINVTIKPYNVTMDNLDFV